jgi:hypothetical protein
MASVGVRLTAQLGELGLLDTFIAALCQKVVLGTRRQW